MRMFFAPPEVKAISRYSDFGSHLGVRTFATTVLIAIMLHGVLFGVMASRPHTKIIKIPVRVLNINVGSGISQAAPREEQPAQRAQASEEPSASEASVFIEAHTAEDALEQVLAPVTAPVKSAAAKPVAPVIVPPPHPKVTPVKPKKPETKPETKPEVKAVPPITTPKRFVRELAAGEKPKEQSPRLNPPSRPEEIVQRYEQAISIWISQHKVYPEEAKRNRTEGDAIVRVRINRQGHILYYIIDKTSGDSYIDRAVMGMVRASDPAPAVPDNYPEGDEFEFLVPVSFKLEK